MGKFALKKDPQMLRLEAATWNQAHPVGSKVTVRLRNGVELETRTTSPAEVRAGGISARVKDWANPVAIGSMTSGWEDEPPGLR